jgi:hypothetical protein
MVGDPVDGREDVLLEQVLRVEGNVQHEPARRRAQQVRAVPVEEFPREQAERVFRVVPNPNPSTIASRASLLGFDLHLQHPGHVRRRLLRVLGHQRRVPRRLRHLHPPVVGEQRRGRAEHEDWFYPSIGLNQLFRRAGRPTTIGGKTTDIERHLHHNHSG